MVKKLGLKERGNILNVSKANREHVDYLGFDGATEVKVFSQLLIVMHF